MNRRHLPSLFEQLFQLSLRYLAGLWKIKTLLNIPPWPSNEKVNQRCCNLMCYTMYLLNCFLMLFSIALGHGSFTIFQVTIIASCIRNMCKKRWKFRVTSFRHRRRMILRKNNAWQWWLNSLKLVLAKPVASMLINYYNCSAKPGPYVRSIIVPQWVICYNFIILSGQSYTYYAIEILAVMGLLSLSNWQHFDTLHSYTSGSNKPLSCH